MGITVPCRTVPCAAIGVRALRIRSHLLIQHQGEPEVRQLACPAPRVTRAGLEQHIRGLDICRTTVPMYTDGWVGAWWRKRSAGGTPAARPGPSLTGRGLNIRPLPDRAATGGAAREDGAPHYICRTIAYSDRPQEGPGPDFTHSLAVTLLLRNQHGAAR